MVKNVIFRAIFFDGIKKLFIYVIFLIMWLYILSGLKKIPKPQAFFICRTFYDQALKVRK